MENRNERENLWSSEFLERRSSHFSTTGWFSPMTVFVCSRLINFVSAGESSL